VDITIEWPDGVGSELESVPADQVLTITRPAPRSSRSPWGRRPDFAADLAPALGLYWIRLEQAGRVLTRKAVLVP